MMKDYAKYPMGKPRRAANSTWHAEWYVLILLVLIVLGLVAVAYVHKMRSQLAVSPTTARFIADAKLFFHRHETPPTKNTSKPLVKAEPEPKVHFNFYDALPAMQANVAPASTSTSTTTTVATETKESTSLTDLINQELEQVAMQKSTQKRAKHVIQK